MILYDGKGKAYNVPHALDVKDWLATGKYFKTNPKKGKKGTQSSLPETEEIIDSEKANQLVRNLSTIIADDVKSLARYLKLPYTTKEETVTAIKEKIGR